jgi:hypothetical protein
MTSAEEYRDELWQSGDHVIEVINRGNSTTDYNVIFSNGAIRDISDATTTGIQSLINEGGL